MTPFYKTLLLISFLFSSTPFIYGQSCPNRALDFDGADDNVTFPTSPINGLTQFTIEAWFLEEDSDGSTNGCGTFERLMSFGDGTANGRLEFGTCQGEFAYVIASGTATQTGVFVNDNNWHHMAFVRDGSNYQLYIDGALEESFTNNNYNAGPNFVLGRWLGTANNALWEGKVDELRFWNTNRSASEIAEFWNCAINGDEPDLINYYPFDQGIDGGNNAGETTLDDIVGANDGTLLNFALFGLNSNWICNDDFDSCAPPCDATFIIINGLDFCGNNFSFIPDVQSPDLTYFWSFGNGDTSTDMIAIYEYPNEGTFNVTLTVSGPGCFTTTSQQVTITFLPQADFTFIKDCLTATFTGSPSNINWTWDFGGVGSATGPVTTFTFPFWGTYQVCAFVDDGICQREICQFITFTDTEPPIVECEDVTVFVQECVPEILYDPEPPVIIDNCVDPDDLIFYPVREDGLDVTDPWPVNETTCFEWIVLDQQANMGSCEVCVTIETNVFSEPQCPPSVITLPVDENCEGTVPDFTPYINFTGACNDKEWIDVSVGRDHYLAIAADGTLWGAGQNSNGSVGTGGTVPKTRLTQIGTDTDWMQVSAGSGYTLALKTDGSMWAWGNNSNGQLGLGLAGAPELTPVAVQPGTTWLDIAASGGGHSYGIRTDNTMWAWGANSVGQLGIGTSGSPVLNPTQIPGNWVDVATGNGNHALAINNLGELFAWGKNDDGQLGQGSVSPFETTPQQVTVAGVNWIDLGAGNGTSIALASNGTLYSWGSNGTGQLGNLVVPIGNNQLTPAPLSGSDWVDIQGFSQHFMARKTDGSLWSWGVNSAGELVDGTQTIQALPVMAGPDMDWTVFDVGISRSVAIKADGSLYVGGNNGGEFLGVPGGPFLLQWVQVLELNTLSGGTVIVTSTPPQGTILSLGSHIVTVEINIIPVFGDPPLPIFCDVELIFVDLTPPTIICPEDICEFFPVDNGGGVVNYPDPIAADNCNVTVTCIPPAGAFFNFGITTVNCTAMDDAGNLAVCNFDVEVKELVNVCDTVCVVDSLIVDTGYDPITGGTITPGLGLGDPLWNLISVPASAPDQTVPRPAFVIDAFSSWNTLPGTEWLSSEQFPNYPENNCNSGDPCNNCDPFIFERCFCLCDDGEVEINFDIYHDDLARVFLYDATLGTSTLLYEECTASTGNFTGTPPMYSGTFDLLEGSYCLRVELINASSVAMGFNLDGSIKGASVESDACCAPVSNIFGAKFNDLDGDGEWDQTLVSGGTGFFEPGLGGWEITLCDDTGAVVQTTTTDNDGNYAFVGIPPGTYTVKETLINGWVPTSPIGGSQVVTVGPLESVTVNFGNNKDCQPVDISTFSTVLTEQTEFPLNNIKVAIPNSAGNYAFAGIKKDDVSGEPCLYFGEINANGNLVIAPTCIEVLATSGSSLPVLDQDFLSITMIEVSSGGYLVAANNAAEGGTNSDVRPLLIRLNAMGCVDWIQQIDLPLGVLASGYAFELFEKPGGGFWLGVERFFSALIPEGNLSLYEINAGGTSCTSTNVTPQLDPGTIYGAKAILPVNNLGGSNAAFAVAGIGAFDENSLTVHFLDNTFLNAADNNYFYFDADGDAMTQEVTAQMAQVADQLYIAGTTADNKIFVANTLPFINGVFNPQLNDIWHYTPIMPATLAQLTAFKASDMMLAADGNLAIIGYAFDPSNPDDRKAFLLRINQQGIVQSISLFYDGTFNYSIANDISRTTDGGLLISGGKYQLPSLSGTNFHGAWIAKTDVMGEIGECECYLPIDAMITTIPSDVFVEGLNIGNNACSLTAMNDNCLPLSDNQSFCDQSTVPTNCEVEIAFTVNNCGDTYTFEPIPNDGANTYSWTFTAGGSPVNGAIQTHTYPSNGNYLVTLTMTTPDGCVAEASIVVNVVLQLDPSFTYSVDCKTVFIDGMPNDPMWIWTWDYGPGGTGSGATDVVVFPNYGTFQICATVTDIDGECEVEICEDVTLVDEDPPTINCVANYPVDPDPGSCTSSFSMPDPTISDNCTANSDLILTYTRDGGGDINDPWPIGTTCVTWTVEDEAGLTATCVSCVTVSDVAEPIINCPTDDIEVPADDFCTAVLEDYTNIVEVCPGQMTPVITQFPAPGTVLNLGCTTVVIEINTGNETYFCEFDVCVVDVTPPTIECPGDITLPTDPGLCTRELIYIIQFNDNCSDVAPIQLAGLPSGALFPVGTTTNTYEVEDDAGLTASCSFDVTIVDEEAPTGVCVDEVTPVDPGLCTATFTPTPPVLSDNCTDPSLMVPTGIRDDNMPLNAPWDIGTTCITWTFMDEAGNSNTCVSCVTVFDEPSITCPMDTEILVANADCEAEVPDYSALVNACPGSNVNYMQTPAAGTIIGLGCITVDVSIETPDGTLIQCLIDLCVEDQTPPTIECPGDITLPTDPGLCTRELIYIIQFNDNCSDVAPIQLAGLPSGALFPVGTTTNTYEVEDDAGLTASCSFDVTIVDEEAPTGICMDEVTPVDPGLCTATFTPIPPVLSDNCTDPSLMVPTGMRDDNMPLNAPWEIGTTCITWTFTDEAGNSNTCVSCITVFDEPSISCPSITEVYAANANCEAEVPDYSALVNACPGTNVNYMQSPTAGTIIGLGCIIVTVSIETPDGVLMQCLIEVCVEDQTPPTIECPNDICEFVQIGTSGTNVTFPDPIVTDNCGATWVCSSTSGDFFPVGVTTVVCTATDGIFTVDCNFDVEVKVDSSLSIFECGQAILTCAGNSGADFVVGMKDIRDNNTFTPSTAPQNANTVVPSMMHPTWTRNNLGQVFGLAIDDQDNIYVTPTTIYQSDAFGPSPNNTGGEVYQLDAATGAANLYTTLPNGGEGLGNLCFAAPYNSLYVTNWDDGMIYQVDMASPGTPTGYDFFGAPNNPADFYAPLEEMLWGIAYREADNRLYFGVWNENVSGGFPPCGLASQRIGNKANEIWSVELLPTGAPNTSTLQLEITLPGKYGPMGDWTSPVSDIAFSGDEQQMIFSERSMCSPDQSGAHRARVLEYVFSGGIWVSTANNYYIGNTYFNSGTIAGGANSAGGVDYGYEFFDPATQTSSPVCDNWIWSTVDIWKLNGLNGPHLCSPSNTSPECFKIYGIQGVPTGGNNPLPIGLNSYLIDASGGGNNNEKTLVGDVEIFDCGCSNIPSMGTCDSLIVVLDSIPMGDTCCYSVDVINSYGPSITKLKVTLQTAGVKFNNVTLASGYTFAAPPLDDELLIESTSGNFPTGVINDLLTFCYGNLTDPLQDPQSLLFEWYETLPGGTEVVVCEEQFETDCPFVPGDDCVDVQIENIICDPDNPTEYIVDFSIVNNSGGNVNGVILEIDQIDYPGFGFKPCFPPVTISSPAILVNFPSVVNGGTSGTLCVKIVSPSGILSPTDICFGAGLLDENGMECCHEPEEFCVELLPCCDPCEDIEIITESLQGDPLECCWELEIDIPCELGDITRIETEVLTPGVIFGSHWTGTGGAFWGNPLSTDMEIHWEQVDGSAINGGIDEVIFFCLDDINQASEVPQQVEVRFVSVGPAGEEVVCSQILEFECEVETDYSCITILDSETVCLADMEKYEYTFTFINNSDPANPADKLLINTIPAFGADFVVSPNVIPLSPVLNPGDPATVTTCIYSTVGFPYPQSQVKLDMRLGYNSIDSTWCCFESDTICVTLPPCDSSCTCAGLDPFTVTDPTGTWSAITGVQCGDNVVLPECAYQFDLSGLINCEPDSCNATYDWELVKVGGGCVSPCIGNFAAGNNIQLGWDLTPGINPPNESGPGIYELHLNTHCGNTSCDDCFITFEIACDTVPPGDCCLEFNGITALDPFNLMATGPSDFIDADNDGDKDLITYSNFLGPLDLYIVENIGTASAPDFDFVTPIAMGLTGYERPFVYDYDGDGDDDFFTLKSTGLFLPSEVYYHENNGIAGISFNLNYTGLDIDFAFASFPEVGDLSNDGLPDIVAGGSTAGGLEVVYFEHITGADCATASAGSPCFQLAANSYTSPLINIPAAAAGFPTLEIFDADCDGDEDLFTVSYADFITGWEVWSFENYGGVVPNGTAPDLETISYAINPHGLESIPYLWEYAYLRFVDIDNDNEAEAFFDNVVGAGPNMAHKYFFENCDDAPSDECCLDFDGVTAQNPFNLAVGVSIDFIDIDNDFDLDYIQYFPGQSNISYQENIGSQTLPNFDPVLSTIPYGGGQTYAFDYEGDGFTDLLKIDENSGELIYYQNDASAGASFTEIPLGIIVEPDPSPSGIPYSQIQLAVGDISNDGIADLVLAYETYPNRKILYYEGACVAPTPPCFTLTANNLSSPFIETPGNIGEFPSLELFDGDCDGDLDLFVGLSQEIRYFENYGTTVPSGTLPDMEMLSPVSNPFGITINNVSEFPVPRFADIDDDGFSELFTSDLIEVNFYENCDICSDDQIPPTITCPSLVTEPTAIGVCEAYYDPVLPEVEDNCTDPDDIVVTWMRSDGALNLGDPYLLGTTTITWTATDQAGNSVTCVETVTVFDNEPPTIICPPDICEFTPVGTNGKNVFFADPVAADNCQVTWTCTQTSGDFFPLGVTTVICTADDGINPPVDCMFNIEVKEDTTCCLNFNGVTSINPFNLGNTSNFSQKEFIDMDNDGDYDLFPSTTIAPNIGFFDNSGSSTSPFFESVPTPTLIDKLGTYTVFEDGPLGHDIFSIYVDPMTSAVDIYYYRNQGVPGVIGFQQVNLGGSGLAFSSFNIAVGDLSNDGIPDMVGVFEFGDVYYWEGQCNYPANPIVFPCFGPPQFLFNSTAGSYFPNPELYDGDCDGDLDLFIDHTGEIRFYENTGVTVPSGSLPPLLTGSPQVNPFGISGLTGYTEFPFSRFVDIDADGDAELFAFDPDEYKFFENCGDNCCDIPFQDFVLNIQDAINNQIEQDCGDITVTPTTFDYCDIVTYTWGDGSPPVTVTGNTPVSHTYNMTNTTYGFCISVERMDEMTGNVCISAEECIDLYIEPCCECGDVVNPYVTGSFMSSIPLVCGGPTVTLPCPAPYYYKFPGYWFGGDFLCDGDANCDSDMVIYEFRDALGNLIVSGTVLSTPHYEFTIEMSDIPLPGDYTVTVRKMCGFNDCECVFNVNVPASCFPPCSCNSLEYEISHGFSVVAGGSCTIREFYPKGIQACDDVEWFVDGNLEDVTGGYDAFIHDFNAEGSYEVCMEITRQDPDGTVCNEEYCRNVRINCTPHIYCPDEWATLVADPNFTSIPFEGQLTPFGNVELEEWKAFPTASPYEGGYIYAKANAGSFDEGYLVLAGGKDRPAAVSQALDISGTQFNQFEISFHVWNLKPQFQPGGGNIIIWLYTNAETDAILLAQYEIPDNLESNGWREVQLVTPIIEDVSNFQKLVFEVTNDAPDNGTNDALTYIGLDNICFYGPVADTEVSLDNGFRLYPNPTNGQLSLEFDQMLDSDYTYRLLDVRGSEIQAGKLDAGNNIYRLDLQRFPSGVYLFELTGENSKPIYSKVIVQD